MIARRHVFYIEGYDPQGVPGYYRLFRRELDRFRRIWPVAATLSPPEVDEDGIAARWRATLTGPDWQVSTTYEFLRWDDLIVRDMSLPMWKRVPRALACFAENLFNGTILRVFRAAWRFGLFYLYPTLMLMLLVTLPVLLGAVAGFAADSAGSPLWLAALLGAGLAAGIYVLLRPLADRWFVVQLVDDWLWGNDWANGRRADYEARMDEFARRIVARARAGGADEIVVIGHSAGATTVIPVIARALALDPDFARAGPPVTVVTMGSALPLAALHPKSAGVREAIRRVATEPSLAWVEFQARKDIINFHNFDPVGGVGVDAGPQRCNPQVVGVRMRDLLAPEFYARIRWNFFRVHYQFIMANDRRAAYDHLMMILGPLPYREWARDGERALARFGGDAAVGTAAPRLAVHA
jgi:hypothetical protein